MSLFKIFLDHTQMVIKYTAAIQDRARTCNYFYEFSPIFLRFGNWKYSYLQFMCHWQARHCGFWSLLVERLIWCITTNCNFSATSLQKREARENIVIMEFNGTYGVTATLSARSATDSS